MPKIISDYERERTLDAVIRHTKALIVEKKGIRDITVDDIVRSVGMSKGSFYSYFKSKEECFYRVLEVAVADVYEQVELIKKENITTKEKAVKYIENVFMSEERVDFYFATTDVEALFRKLPPEYSQRENDFSGTRLIANIMEIMEIDAVHAEAFYTLLECIEFVSVSKISDEAKSIVINVLTETLSDFAGKHSKV